MVGPDPVEVENKSRELMQTLPMHRWSVAIKTLVFGVFVLGIGLFLIKSIDPKVESSKLAIAVTVSVLGGSIAIFALIVMADTPARKKRLSEMLSGEHVAHWTYSPEEWKRYQNYQAKRRDESFTLDGNTFMTCALVALVFGVLAFLVTIRWEEYRGETVAIAFAGGFGLCVVVKAFERLSWGIWCNRLKKRIGETLISEHGVYFHSVFFSWGSFGSRLESLTLDEDTSISVLRFVFALRMNNGESERELEVPVPDDEDAAAVLKRLGS